MKIGRYQKSFHPCTSLFSKFEPPLKKSSSCVLALNPFLKNSSELHKNGNIVSTSGTSTAAVLVGSNFFLWGEESCFFELKMSIFSTFFKSIGNEMEVVTSEMSTTKIRVVHLGTDIANWYPILLWYVSGERTRNDRWRGETEDLKEKISFSRGGQIFTVEPFSPKLLSIKIRVKKKCEISPGYRSDFPEQFFFANRVRFESKLLSGILAFFLFFNTSCRLDYVLFESFST